jgi:ribosomal 50S subunit-recycling heat shock protein
MRVDLFLKLSGMVKTRSKAGKACKAGRVSVNGRTAKPSVDVKEGDLLEVGMPGGRTVRARVDEIPSSRQVSRKDRKSLYTVLPKEDHCS